MLSGVRNVGFAGRVVLSVCACWLMFFCLVGTAGAQPYELAFWCEMPVDATAEERSAFDAYHACTAPFFWEWLGQYPEEVARLEDIYVGWKAGRGHDLRGQKAAEAWLEKYPVWFDAVGASAKVEGVEQAIASVQVKPVRVSGAFERLVVDRDGRQLLLTSEKEGLVSINMARRYVLKKMGSAKGLEDFFAYDGNVAFREEPAKGDIRDLVVLDISDRAGPKEVGRVKGALQRTFELGRGGLRAA